MSHSSSQPQPTSKNYSFLAIPTAYALAYPPHLYQFYRGMVASKYATTNTVPRGNLELIRDRIPADTYKSLMRARGAHLNALEGFPLFAAAMLAGNYVNLPTKDLNWAAGQYIATRVLYTALYMTTTNEVLSYVRSSVYFWNVGIPFYVLYKAGCKVRDGEAGKEKEL